MLSHIVLYNSYKSNCDAVPRVIKEAERVLRPVVRQVGARFHIAPAASFDRPVSDLKFDVGLYCGFPDFESFQTYMEHPDHMEWCNFVLKGWKLVGSSSGDTHAEFVNYILGSKTGGAIRPRERDHLPDSEVVWDGEHVFDFAND